MIIQPCEIDLSTYRARPSFGSAATTVSGLLGASLPNLLSKLRLLTETVDYLAVHDKSATGGGTLINYFPAAFGPHILQAPQITNVTPAGNTALLSWPNHCA